MVAIMRSDAVPTPLDGLTVYPVRNEDDHQHLRQWLQMRDTVAVDTETTGVSYWDQLRLVQVGDCSTVFVIDATEAKEVLTDLLSGRYQLLLHNAAFDIPHLVRVTGHDTANVMRYVNDTMTMAQLVDPRPSDSGGVGHGLKALADHYLGAGAIDSQKALKQRFKELGIKRQADGFAQIPLWDETYVCYSGVDVALTARLYHHLLPMMTELELLKIWDIEREVAALTTAMTVRGIKVDLAAAYRARDELQLEYEQAVDAAALLGIANVNSNRQIISVLEADGVTLKERTKSGQPKVDRDVLSKLDHPAASAIIEAKQASKALSSWVQPIIDQAVVDGRVHARIKSNGAMKTGRMSVSDPPLQQLPRGDWRVRACLIPDDDHSMITIDWSNIEVRVMAYLANESKLIDAFVAGANIHDTVATSLFGEGFTPEQRNIAKSTVFGKLYGAGPRTLAKTAGVSEAQAKTALDKLSIKYPRLQRWSKQLVERAKITRQPQVTLTGRRLPIEQYREFAITNHVTQSTAADLLKTALVQLGDQGLAHHVLMCVHDEFVLQIPNEQIEELTEAIRSCMEGQLGEVPIVADAEYAGASWGEKYRPKDSDVEKRSDFSSVLV
jgi:DNA polymerase-1